MKTFKTHNLVRLVSIFIMMVLMFSFFTTMAQNFMLQLATVTG